MLLLLNILALLRSPRREAAARTRASDAGLSQLVTIVVVVVLVVFAIIGVIALARHG